MYRLVRFYLKLPLFFVVGTLFLSFPALVTSAQGEVDAELTLSQPLTLKWTFKTDLTTNLTPASVGDRIFFPLAAGLLMSFKSGDGLLIWKAELGGELSSSPIADERSVFIASEAVGGKGISSQAKGAIRALGLDGGVTQWMRTLPMPIRGALAANDKYLYGGASDGRVYALKKRTGDVTWIMQYSAPFASSPTVFGSNLYIGNEDGSLFSLDPSTGKINWRYRTRGTIRGRAVLIDGIVYFGSSDGFVYALRNTDGRLRWRRRTGAGVQTVAATQNGLLVASLDNFVYFLSLGNGDTLWKRQLPGRINAEPLIRQDGVLFTSLSSPVGTVLDLKNGKPVNNLEVGEDNDMIAGPILVGDMVFLTTRHGLMAFSRPH